MSQENVHVQPPLLKWHIENDESDDEQNLQPEEQKGEKSTEFRDNSVNAEDSDSTLSLDELLTDVIPASFTGLNVNIQTTKIQGILSSKNHCQEEFLDEVDSVSSDIAQSLTISQKMNNVSKLPHDSINNKSELQSDLQSTRKRNAKFNTQNCKKSKQQHLPSDVRNDQVKTFDNIKGINTLLTQLKHSKKISIKERKRMISRVRRALKDIREETDNVLLGTTPIPDKTHIEMQLKTSRKLCDHLIALYEEFPSNSQKTLVEEVQQVREIIETELEGMLDVLKNIETKDSDNCFDTHAMAFLQPEINFQDTTPEEAHNLEEIWIHNQNNEECVNKLPYVLLQASYEAFPQHQPYNNENISGDCSGKDTSIKGVSHSIENDLHPQVIDLTTSPNKNASSHQVITANMTINNTQPLKKSSKSQILKKHVHFNTDVVVHNKSETVAESNSNTNVSKINSKQAYFSSPNFTIDHKNATMNQEYCSPTTQICMYSDPIPSTQDFTVHPVSGHSLDCHHSELPCNQLQNSLALPDHNSQTFCAIEHPIKQRCIASQRTLLKNTQSRNTCHEDDKKKMANNSCISAVTEKNILPVLSSSSGMSSEPPLDILQMDSHSSQSILNSFCHGNYQNAEQSCTQSNGSQPTQTFFQKTLTFSQNKTNHTLKCNNVIQNKSPLPQKSPRTVSENEHWFSQKPEISFSQASVDSLYNKTSQFLDRINDKNKNSTSPNEPINTEDYLHYQNTNTQSRIHASQAQVAPKTSEIITCVNDTNCRSLTPSLQVSPTQINLPTCQFSRAPYLHPSSSQIHDKAEIDRHTSTAKALTAADPLLASRNQTDLEEIDKAGPSTELHFSNKRNLREKKMVNEDFNSQTSFKIFQSNKIVKDVFSTNITRVLKPKLPTQVKTSTPIVTPNLPWQTGKTLPEPQLPNLPKLPCPFLQFSYEFNKFTIPKLPWEDEN